MNYGRLSSYFTDVAAKILSAVEADVLRSNQHEFNGVEGLKRIFGSAKARVSIPARFLYLNDIEDTPVSSDGFLTWYDARARHPTRSEHRLYFPDTDVSERARQGDLLIVARREDGSALVTVAAADSTIANQLLWLFGLRNAELNGFAIRTDLGADSTTLSFAARAILESIGIEIPSPSIDFLEMVRTQFGEKFPTTREFSGFARSTLPEVTPEADEDRAILVWMEREEALFRALERLVVQRQLQEGFGTDVDRFISFSLSVQNRRKSRAGAALENHLEFLFGHKGIRFARSARTENNAKPDFLFPGTAQYADPAFPVQRLTMLGVKSSCKDRWRQVLAEADRIPEKHLLTLEPGISAAQTAEMRSKNVQLVIPRGLHATYLPQQQSHLMDVATFCARVGARQSEG